MGMVGEKEALGGRRCSSAVLLESKLPEENKGTAENIGRKDLGLIRGLLSARLLLQVPWGGGRRFMPINHCF